VVGRIDSAKGGRVRVDIVPDAPVSKFRLELFGGRKGLIVNSRNLCKGTHRATVKLRGHNGKQSNYKTPLKATGCKKKGKKRPRRHAH
jgi:hypothetical protein